MGFKISSATLGFALALASTSAVVADQPGHDKSIELAAAKLAAAKIGKIRGSIDHDQEPILVERVKDQITTGSVRTFERPAWMQEPDQRALTPMVRTQQIEVDLTMTGSVLKPKLPPVNLPSSTNWDRFDKNGRQIRTFD